jgi:hypothetical protein
MSKNKVGKGRKGKERKNMSWHFHPSVGENGVEHFCTRVKASNVMTCANFGIDILRDIDSGGCKKIGVSPLLRGWALQLQHYRAAVITSSQRARRYIELGKSNKLYMQ